MREMEEDENIDKDFDEKLMKFIVKEVIRNNENKEEKNGGKKQL